MAKRSRSMGEGRLFYVRLDLSLVKELIALELLSLKKRIGQNTKYTYRLSILSPLELD
jgi:hypothetical protein